MKMKILDLFWKVESIFSPRIIEESQKWMREQSYWLETLSPEQQNTVHRYIDRRRKFKKNIGLYIFNLIGTLVVLLFVADFLDQKRADILQLPQSIVADQETKVGLKEANEVACLYAVIGLIAGLYLGIAMHMVFSLGTTFWDLTILRKTIQAFLPATKRT
jgi:hypothetical protein